jgi:hypothetical protein
LEEAGKCGRTWSEVQRSVNKESDGDASQMPHVPNGPKDILLPPLFIFKRLIFIDPLPTIRLKYNK